MSISNKWTMLTYAVPWYFSKSKKEYTKKIIMTYMCTFWKAVWWKQQWYVINVTLNKMLILNNYIKSFDIFWQVTWIRKGNLHIISANEMVYSPDSRYKVRNLLFLSYISYCISGRLCNNILNNIYIYIRQIECNIFLFTAVYVHHMKIT